MLPGRGFLDGTAKYAVGGITAVGILEALAPKYSEAQTQIQPTDARIKTAGFMAAGPDALTSLGGYPGADEVGVEMQRKLEQPKMMANFVATARYLKTRPDSTGRIGVTGFCFGGGVANNLAVQLGPDMAASVPFYDGQPRAEDVPKITAAMLIHYAEDDMRINAGTRRRASIRSRQRLRGRAPSTTSTSM